MTNDYENIKKAGNYLVVSKIMLIFAPIRAL
jgi:hypothetical protein